MVIVLFDALSLRCVAMSKIFVPWCVCVLLVYCVHPVIVLLYFVIRSFTMFVLRGDGDQIVLAYHMIGCVIVLYVFVFLLICPSVLS